MAKNEIAVKKYVVRLSKDERAQLEALIRKGKSPAKQQLKARILLKADVSKEGEGWSDSQIIRALNTSVSMVYRVRQQLVEEGFEAVLRRKQRATPPVPRIFDGEKEAKLITLACSQAPPGQARWTLNPTSRIGAVFYLVPVVYQRVRLKGLHYGSVCWVGLAAVIRGGGWGGNWSLSWLIRSCSSGSG
jgi:transposase